MVLLKVSVIIFTIIIVAILIMNIIFYSEASKGTCTNISIGFATFMLWFSVVLLILTVGIFIFSLIRLFRQKKSDKLSGELAEMKEQNNREPKKHSRTYTGPSSEY